MRHTLLTLLLACVACLGLQAQTPDEDNAATVQAAKPAVPGKLARVYMFGCSIAFADSVAYITELQPLDSVYLQYNGFLVNRTLYTVQLDNYVRNQFACSEPTTAIFFSKSKKKAEQMYLRVRRKQTMRGIRFTQLHSADFAFLREGWAETISLEETQE